MKKKAVLASEISISVYIILKFTLIQRERNSSVPVGRKKQDHFLYSDAEQNL